MTDLEFKKYRDDLRKTFAGLTLTECVNLRNRALTLRQAELLLCDIQLRIDYLRSGSKSMNDEFKKIMNGLYMDGTESSNGC